MYQPSLQPRSCYEVDESLHVPWQVLSVHLNRICAMAALRKSSQSCCLVGCLGEVNAGKTTLMRGLMGLAPEPEGFERRNATRHIAAQRMHLHTSTGLRPDPAAPVLVDTPGFFDTDETLRDVALQQSGQLCCQQHQDDAFMHCCS